MIGPRPDAAPTIVMLHEGLGCVGLWGAFPGAACVGDRRRRVCLFARRIRQIEPGKAAALGQLHGRGSAATCCRACSTAIGFQRGILFGHSDGASIATIYAGSVQDHRVRGLVLMAPHFFTEEMGLAAIRRTREDFAAGTLREKLKRWHDDVDCAFRSWNGPWLDPEFAQMGHHRSAWLYPRADPDRAGRRRSIRHAQADRGGGARNATARSRRRCCRASRHSPHRDAPELTLEAACGFINRLLARPSRRRAADTIPGLRPSAL